MASVFGHGIVAYTLSKVLNGKNAKWLIILAVFSSIFPDIDVITFHLDIPYEAPLGHRGFTHSIVFAIIWALFLMFTLGKQNKRLWFTLIFLSTLSHGLLDAITTGGRGVGFLIPFNNDRFFFPFRKIVVSPIEISSFFSEWGLQVVLSEIKYILLPSFIILAVRFLSLKIFRKLT